MLPWTKYSRRGKAQRKFAMRAAASSEGRVTYRFAFKTYRRALAAPLRTVHGPWREREGVLIRLEDETGAVGYGETAPIPWFGTETVAETTALCSSWGSLVEDEKLAAVPEWMGCLRFAVAAAKAEVERGLRTRLEPVQRPGSTSQRLPVAALLPAGRGALERLPDFLERGFFCLKWKVGVGDAPDEMAIMDDLLAALPAYVKLRLDANGGWDRRTAEKWLARCAERPVEFVEQPVAPGARDVLHGLAADYPVKLALDESVVLLDSARRWQAEGWPGIFVFKPALCGPLPEIATWVHETKADVVLSSAIETVVGKAAILLWALAGAVTTRALGFGVGTLFGARTWDGPEIGPIVDGNWCMAADPEALWNELS
jgi:O-succinylbenzoate synthase